MQSQQVLEPSEWIEKLREYGKTQGATSEYFEVSVLGKMIFLNAHATAIGQRTAAYALGFYERLNPKFGLDIWVAGDRLDRFLPGK